MSKQPDKKTDEKTYGPYSLPEVVVMAPLSHKQRLQLGMYLHRNPAAFRKIMKSVKTQEQQQYYFNLCFNAARQEAGDATVKYAFAIAGGIQSIAAAGAGMAASAVFARQGAKVAGQLMNSARHLSGVARMANWRAYYAATNTIRNVSSNVSSITSAMQPMLSTLVTPQNFTLKNMITGGAIDFLAQSALQTYLKHQEQGKKNIAKAFTNGLNEVNFFGVGISSSGLPIAMSAFASSFISISRNGSIRTVFTGKIPYEQGIKNGFIGTSFGIVGSVTPNLNIPSREIGLSSGISAGSITPELVSPVMHSIHYSTKFIDDTFPYIKNFGISFAEKYIQNETDHIIEESQR